MRLGRSPRSSGAGAGDGARVRAPLLLVHGDDDRCQPLARAERLAELTGAPVVVLEGAGHLPTARHPVKVNLLIRNFLDQLTNRC